MSGAAPAGLGEALAAALRLESFGATAGNVTVARGSFDGRPVHVARVENRAASGSIGAAEAERLTAIFRVVAIERSPLVLDLDSAGAKVSEGLEALGAFRRLFRAGLDAAFAGAPIAAVLGRNCFGGSSMLAHLAGRRLFGPATRLGMSGPAVIAAASGMDPLDASFQAMAEAAMSPEARAAASAANTRWTDAMDLVAWLREALAASRDPRAEFRRRHDALAARLSPPAAADAGEPVRRRDLERIYPQGCDARESHGLLAGRGRTHEGEERFVGLVGDKPLGAQRAWRFADLAWRDPGGGTLRVLLDCASHATRLEEERIVLTEFIVDMSLALEDLARRGTRVLLTIVGKAGGGVYVALAAPARHVAAVHGAQIQVLPGAAVTAILGSSRDAIPSFADYHRARVAEEELKLGLIP
ncbi:MAG TPA: carboxyl transferase domain-containing protein [Usitatibacter sp.]|nr:carboxyl transferase domain-containing protein [Usitatibacter sp.]